MKDAIARLLGSRKFLLAVVATVVLGALVYAGKLPMSEFATRLQQIIMVLIAAIGAEGVAEKWNVPPLPPAAPPKPDDQGAS